MAVQISEIKVKYTPNFQLQTYVENSAGFITFILESIMRNITIVHTNNMSYRINCQMFYVLVHYYSVMVLTRTIRSKVLQYSCFLTDEVPRPSCCIKSILNSTQYSCHLVPYCCFFVQKHFRIVHKE